MSDTAVRVDSSFGCRSSAGADGCASTWHSDVGHARRGRWNDCDHPVRGPARASSPCCRHGTTSAPNPERVRDYQERLKALDARAAQEARNAALPVGPASAPAVDDGPQVARATDPIVADRKRRAYESLFASNVVLSRRPDAQRPDAGSTCRGRMPRMFFATRRPRPSMPSQTRQYARQLARTVSLASRRSRLPPRPSPQRKVPKGTAALSALRESRPRIPSPMVGRCIAFWRAPSSTRS